MAIDAKRILLGKPDQLVTGAVLSAPVGTPLPTSATAPISDLFKDSGFVNEDGVKSTQEKSYEDIKDWSGAVVRKVISESSFTVEFTFLETDIFALQEVFGEENITITPATEDHGAQIFVNITNGELPHKSFIFKMKDGTNRVILVIPDGQVTTDSLEIEYVAGTPIQFPCTISAFPTPSGEFAYLANDDGVTTTVEVA
jgi:hypothetical protein